MPRYQTPDAVYAELFKAVQMGRIFDDSKTFVDALPKGDPAAILDAFRRTRNDDGFELETFVASNFELPRHQEPGLEPDTDRPLWEHIETLWGILTRVADVKREDSSLLALPHPYIVPGGRFREIYYWDSYFTMLGLAASGHVALIKNMVDNFAYLIDHVGFIPNGNRTYYCTRSQPPLFVLMVELLATVTQDADVWTTYLPQLEREYDFWMSGAGELEDGSSAVRRVVSVGDGCLNRYWDDSSLPRAESHAEDVELADGGEREPAGLYRDLRAACESGWDFSSRWFEDAHALRSIRASQIVPIDLNAILWKLEASLASALSEAGDGARANQFEERAARRKQLIQTLFFDDETGFFVDLSLPDLKPTGALSLAAAYPLFFDLATVNQAKHVADKIRREFLKAGGWVTTLVDSGQQWDSPNGWAPLQWIVYRGLRNYGFDGDAKQGAARWVENNRRVYRGTGKLLEKYDVEHLGSLAEGGEYTVQDGFGWTNGVLLTFMNELGIQ